MLEFVAAKINATESSASDAPLHNVSTESSLQPETESAIADEMYEALKGLTEIAYKHSWAHIENVDDGECGCKECRVKYARAAIKKYEDSKK